LGGELRGKISDAILTLKQLIKKISKYNDEFVKKRKKKYQSLFVTPEGHAYDDQQKTAIIVDDKHNLVVAGAGSGKTEVLITRIAYLVKRKDKIKPPQQSVPARLAEVNLRSVPDQDGQSRTHFQCKQLITGSIQSA
jgi:hypothetical protein